MRSAITTAIAIIILAFTASSQTLSNETILSRIKSARAEKHISVTFDPAGKTTKVMAVSENFARSEAGKSGIMAMNFAAGLFYPGDYLLKSAESFQLTFWVMSRKPRFGSNHAMTVALRDEMLVIGSARYVAKPREEMEYLNFEISRENLTKIAGQSEVRFQLGDQGFTFTPSQMKLLADLLMATEL